MSKKLYKSTVREMSEPERAYVGAMIEGEGNIYTPKNGLTQLNVVNTNVEIISALIRATGVGRVYLKPNSNFHHSNAWIWRACRQQDISDIARQCGTYSEKLSTI